VLSLLRAQDRRPAPWKNGQGLTTEIAIDPPGADLQRFDWRVSLAEVTASGPFSRFPGVDRWLAVLDGAMSLSVEGRGDTHLSAESDPIQFPGDVAALAVVIHGPVRDLNIMSARGRIGVRAERLRLAPGTTPLTAAQASLIVCLDGALWVSDAQGAHHALTAADAALVTEAEGERLTLIAEAPTDVVVAGFTRLA
jgi:hypothetical protein